MINNKFVLSKFIVQAHVGISEAFYDSIIHSNRFTQREKALLLLFKWVIEKYPTSKCIATLLPLLKEFDTDYDQQCLLDDICQVYSLLRPGEIPSVILPCFFRLEESNLIFRRKSIDQTWLNLYAHTDVTINKLYPVDDIIHSDELRHLLLRTGIQIPVEIVPSEEEIQTSLSLEKSLLAVLFDPMRITFLGQFRV